MYWFKLVFLEEQPITIQVLTVFHYYLKQDNMQATRCMGFNITIIIEEHFIKDKIISIKELSQKNKNEEHINHYSCLSYKHYFSQWQLHNSIMLMNYILVKYNHFIINYLMPKCIHSPTMMLYYYLAVIKELMFFLDKIQPQP